MCFTFSTQSKFCYSWLTVGKPAISTVEGRQVYLSLVASSSKLLMRNLSERGTLTAESGKVFSSQN